MKIAMFLTSFPVWSETFILNQISGLIDRGHEVHIYARSRNRSNTNHAIISRYRMLENTHFASSVSTRSVASKIRKVAALLLRDLNFLNPRFWALIWKNRHDRSWPEKWSRLSLLYFAISASRGGPYDIIHCQFGHLAPVATYLMGIGALKGKLVTSFRGHDLHHHKFAESGIYDELFKKGDLFLPVSEELKGRLIRMGCPETRIQVHHSGIDCTKFAYREKPPAEGMPIGIITIARLVENKGLKYSIEAISKLVKAGKHVTYNIVGDGALRDELISLVEKLGVRNNIHILGWKSHEEVADLLSKSGILVLPSITTERGDAEGIPNSVKEAMAMGLPVVCTRVGGTPELVEDGVSGFLVVDKDTEALADRLAFLCDHPEKWVNYGRAGRRRIEGEFDINRLNDQLVALYKRLLSDQPERS